MIGWVGLLIAHIARFIIGPRFHVLLPVSMLLGGAYLLLMDDLVRSFEVEIHLGILTALRAVAQTNSEVDTAENILWWGLIPIWLAAALWVLTLFHLQVAPAWAYAVIGIIMVIALMLESSKHRSIQNRSFVKIASAAQ